MRNNIIVLILINLFISNVITCAQVTKFKKQKLFDIPSAKITDINFQNDLCYIKTKDSLFIFTKDGKRKAKKKENENYNCFVKNKLFSIKNNAIYDDSNEKVIETPKEYLKNKTTKFLSFSNNNFYSCVFDTTKLYFSNSISTLKNESEPTIFCYLVGIPSGLFSDDEYLWYLYNTHDNNSNGILRKYNLKSRDLISEYEIPVINPIGLTIKGDSIYTYSNFTKEFIQLTKIGLDL